MSKGLTEAGKILLLSALLAKDGLISQNGSSFLKELVLRRDPRVADLLRVFETKDEIIQTGKVDSNKVSDASFLEQVHELISNEACALYNELFADTSLEVGKTLSKDEREQRSLNEEKSLIYGEVDFHSFYRVLRKINPRPGGIFYDLGSGTGKAVMAARLTRDFSRCIGIEILPSLHSRALEITNRYNLRFRPLLCSGQNQHASVYEGSFLSFDWSDGDFVFANSTCFDDDLMSAIAKKAESLRPGAILVTFTKGIQSSEFEILERKRYRMSWGPATVVIHRRLNVDGSSVGTVDFNILPSDSISYDDDVEEKSKSLNLRGSYDEGDNEDEEVDDDNDFDEDGISDVFGVEEYSGNNQPKSLSPYSKYSASGNIHDNILNSPQDSALLQRKRAANNRGVSAKSESPF